MTEEKVEEKKDENNKEKDEDLLEGLFDFTSQRADELLDKYYKQANNKKELQISDVLKMICKDKDATEQEKIVVAFMLGSNAKNNKQTIDKLRKEEGEKHAEKPLN